MKQELRIGLIGSKFMGRAHSNAWKKAGLFFDAALQPVLQVVCARQQTALSEFAAQWGWQETETDWRKVVSSPHVDAIDIALSTFELGRVADLDRVRETDGAAPPLKAILADRPSRRAPFPACRHRRLPLLVIPS
jgi:hypothetical protein